LRFIDPSRIQGFSFFAFYSTSYINACQTLTLPIYLPPHS
jgi:hypothetical protein